MSYVVRVNDPPAVYKPGYFPRAFHLKKEAELAAQMAIRRGASMARVECPDGAEIDFRPEADHRQSRHDAIRDMLKFSVNEQNSMAMLCEAMAAFSYKLSKGETEFEKLAEELANVALSVTDGCGRSVNWGSMYDRFHRQGVNR